MPSSPEPGTVSPWELVELGRPRSTVTAVRSPGFVADEAAGAPLAPFEIGGAAAIPEALLAPARAEARAAGYLAGWTHGVHDAGQRAAAAARAHATTVQAVEQQRSAAFQQALAALERAVVDLEARATPGAVEVEHLIISTALDIAEALVGHSLRHDECRAEAALTRVLDLAPAGESVEVRLSVADHAVLAGSCDPGSLTLVADATLAPGDAIATAGATQIDARISAGLARVREVLGR